MLSRFLRAIRPIFSWLVFPLVPVFLEDLYYSNTNPGPDPREWDWFSWITMLGPLLGYGFLAGATADIPDDVGTSRWGPRRLLRRRAVWVAIGPWCGWPIGWGVLWGCGFLLSWFPAFQSLPESWKGTWKETAFVWIFLGCVAGIPAYGWL